MVRLGWCITSPSVNAQPRFEQRLRPQGPQTDLWWYPGAPGSRHAARVAGVTGSAARIDMRKVNLSEPHARISEKEEERSRDSHFARAGLRP